MQLESNFAILYTNPNVLLDCDLNIWDLEALRNTDVEQKHILAKVNQGTL